LKISTGKLAQIGKYANGKETGDWNYYDDQGNLIKNKTYICGKVQE
jgi:antitoxin component YwqK of YwqJK toxin-antitoxin module